MTTYNLDVDSQREEIDDYLYQSATLFPTNIYHNEGVRNLLVGIKYCSSWPGHQKELMDFSIQFPLTLFTLTCFGEDSLDIQMLYIKNGGCYQVDASITFPEFDESLLRKPVVVEEEEELDGKL